MYRLLPDQLFGPVIHRRIHRLCLPRGATRGPAVFTASIEVLLNPYYYKFGKESSGDQR